MMDAIFARGQSYTRPHIWAEYREKRKELGTVLLDAESLLRALSNISKPLYAAEQRQHQRALYACGEAIANAVKDMIDDVLGPTARRADDCGIAPEEIVIDVTELDRLLAKLETT
ncbi:MAG: hypothetical protein JSR91_00360 [Proteobacteria bacterium]|nr:hypothetical protein [Pseudomonadota bacterium]